MAHAMRCSSVFKPLASWVGLPIAFSISGCVIALLGRHFGSFELAWDIYVTDLEDDHLSVETVTHAGRAWPGIFFSAASTLSLSFLNGKHRKEWALNAQSENCAQVCVCWKIRYQFLCLCYAECGDLTKSLHATWRTFPKKWAWLLYPPGRRDTSSLKMLD